MAQNSFEIKEIGDLIASIQPLPATNCDDPINGWIRRAQNSCEAKLNHPRISIFVANHGFCEANSQISEYVNKSIEGSSALNRLCQSANTDLRLFEMDLDHPTTNCLNRQDAMSDDDLARTVAYGMMAVEPGLDLMAVTGFGNGTAQSAIALLNLHQNETSTDLTITRLIKTCGPNRGLSALNKIGGFELSAIAGSIIAARLAQIPILLEGVIGASVLKILCHENPALKDHCALCGQIDDATIKKLNIPYLPSFSTIPDHAGIALACTLPHLRNQLILANEKVRFAN